MSARLRLDEIRTTPALRALESEWRALWCECGEASVFQAPEWLLPWWEVFGSGALRTLAVRRGDRLVGIAPLYVYDDPASGERIVLPLGASISDHLDLLLLPDVAGDAARAVLGYLLDIAADWDACALQPLPGTAAILHCPAPDELQATVAEDDCCPVLPLPPSVDRLGDAVPERLLENVRYYTRRAARRGAMRFESARGAAVIAALDALLALHGARWRERGACGVLADAMVQRFHRLAAPRLDESGLLRLYVLHLDDRVAAVYYGFQDRRRASYYLGGFDPAFRQLSPGTLLVHHAVERAIADGATELDFLRGRESYKYLWGARDRPTWRRRFVRAPSAVDVGA